MIDAAKILLAKSSQKPIPLIVLDAQGLGDRLKTADASTKALVGAQGFAAKPLSFVVLPMASGETGAIWVGAPSAGTDPFSLGSLSSKLPEGHYAFEGEIKDIAAVALGWCLELYKYDPFRKADARKATLQCPSSVDRDEVVAVANATYHVRDMINAPANLFGPDELEAEARSVARKFGAKLNVIKGKVLARDFPLIHVVGAASPREPRLIDFTWGKPIHPKLTLVGKGVCFDTGGLDIKPSSNMLLMKKDMGGAANVLGLAQLIMQAKLPVRLRVLIPAVENSIAGAAFRPGDVFKTRKGLTVEIGNTDAEGRLILCEALAVADEENPDVLIDMATLTGAARVALGPDLPPFFTDDDEMSERLAKLGLAVNDPLWRLPLWAPYNSLIETPIADINNAGQGGYAGSITAALFLKRFVDRAKTYVHFDIFGWTPNAKPGRPKGGEAQAMHTLFVTLRERFQKPA
ncbi:MAG: leucyl aminopeptidase family protein [Aestuariivirga sp.]